MWVPDREMSGQVLKEVAPCSLVVEMPEGTCRRNQKHLIQLLVPDPESTVEPQTSDPPEESTESVPVYQTPSKSGRAPKPFERLDPSWT